MTKAECRNEKLYQATMSMARTMLRKGIICEEDYRQIDTMFRQKYEPSLGSLLADIDLIKASSRANMTL